MKTVEEIKTKIAEGGFETDFFGFATDDIKYALPFEEAKQFLDDEFLAKENAEKEWEENRLKTDEDVKEKMLDYLEFAWEKANDERGLSADRSIQHFIAWSWLVDDEMCTKIQELYNTVYTPYGKPILTYIGDQLGYAQ